MARVTALLAYSRAKTKRQNDKNETSRALIKARSRFVRQLWGVGNFNGNGPNPAQDSDPPLRGRGRRPSSNYQLSGMKKITDYFNKTRSLEFTPRVKQPLKTSSSFDQNGIECVTIYDSDNEPYDNNNNMSNYNLDSDLNNLEANMSCGTGESSSWDTDSESDNGNQRPSRPFKIDEDVKPQVARFDVGHLGVSFDDLQLKAGVDEDVEIVEILPPIPLRQHVVYDIEGEGETNATVPN